MFCLCYDICPWEECSEYFGDHNSKDLCSSIYLLHIHLRTLSKCKDEFVTVNAAIHLFILIFTHSIILFVIRLFPSCRSAYASPYSISSWKIYIINIFLFYALVLLLPLLLLQGTSVLIFIFVKGFLVFHWDRFLSSSIIRSTEVFLNLQLLVVNGPFTSLIFEWNGVDRDKWRPWQDVPC